MNSEETNRTYMLAIKRDNNDYLPLEWQYTKYYEKENMSTLDGIDHFTSLYFNDELLEEAVDSKLVNPFEKCKGLSIIYKEKGKFRELKEGVIFYNEEFCLNFEFTCDFLEYNSNNRLIINNIANILGSFRNPSNELIQFIFILRNLSLFESKGPNGIKAAISKFLDIPYEEKRKVALIINRKFGPIYDREEEIVKTLDVA